MKPLLIAGFFTLVQITAFAESPDETFQTGKDALTLKRDFPKAIASFKACLDADVEKEKQEECLNLLAESYWANHEVDQAIWAFNKEIESGKNEKHRATALFRKAMAQMSKGEKTEGMAAYAQLASEYPKGQHAPNALMVQANYAILEEADPRKAIKLYEQIATQYPATEEAKAALQWLPDLRKITSQDVKQQLREQKEQQKIAKKANAK